MVVTSAVAAHRTRTDMRLFAKVSGDFHWLAPHAFRCVVTRPFELPVMPVDDRNAIAPLSFETKWGVNIEVHINGNLRFNYLRVTVALKANMYGADTDWLFAERWVTYRVLAHVESDCGWVNAYISSLFQRRPSSTGILEREINDEERFFGYNPDAAARRGDPYRRRYLAGDFGPAGAAEVGVGAAERTRLAASERTGRLTTQRAADDRTLARSRIYREHTQQRDATLYEQLRDSGFPGFGSNPDAPGTGRSGG